MRNYYNNAQEIMNDHTDISEEFDINSSNTPSPTNSIINELLLNSAQITETGRWRIKNDHGPKRERNKLLKKSCIVYINTKGKQMHAKSHGHVNCDKCHYKCT